MPRTKMTAEMWANLLKASAALYEASGNYAAFDKRQKGIWRRLERSPKMSAAVSSILCKRR